MLYVIMEGNSSRLEVGILETQGTEFHVPSVRNYQQWFPQFNSNDFDVKGEECVN